jgi:hypothetical protein
MIKRNMKDVEYFAVKAASNSTLSHLVKTPAHCKAAMDGPHEDTASMKLGSLVHTLVLEADTIFERYHVLLESDPSAPRKGSNAHLIIASIEAGTFEKEFSTDNKVSMPRGATALAMIDDLHNGDGQISDYIVEPYFNKRSLEGKSKYNDFIRKCEQGKLTVCSQACFDKVVEYISYITKLNGRIVVPEKDVVIAKNYMAFLNAIDGKIVIKDDYLTEARKMAASVMAHPMAGRLFKNGESEVSAFWDDPETGYPCKCRFDYINGGRIVVDLKTTIDASPEGFKKSIADYGYHRQDAFYTEGFKGVFHRYPLAFLFVAVETTPPYCVAVHQINEQSKAIGREEINYFLSTFKECMEADVWPAYSENITEISLPSWYKPNQRTE